MKIHLLVVLCVPIIQNCAHSAEILVVNPVPTYGHFFVPFKLAEELSNRGHHVTCISSYPQSTKLENFVDIPVVENIKLMEDVKNKVFVRAKMGFLENLTSLFDIFATVTNITIHNKNVQKLLESDKKFDVVLMESFFNEAFLGFGYRFNAPVILVNSQKASAMNNFIFANPAFAAYVPVKGGNLPKHMTFWQRIENLIKHIIFDALIHLYHLPQQRKIFKHYITDIELDDVLYNTSLMLTNSHVSISDPIPLVPSIVEIGGFYVTPKDLPDDLQAFLDNATEGVVYFSMGSLLRSDNIKPEKRKAILKAFSRIKQTVLWKFETEMTDLPKNVKIMHWVPQQDLLGHPNVRAFITHGGRLSTIEAVYHGVPLIGIPIFGDQFSNVAAAVEDGYAVHLSLDELTEETLFDAMQEILTNPRYKENIRQRSRLMHDQPLKPMDAAVFWVEHVIRHRGAPHLRSAGLDLKWYQRELIDVFAFLFVVVCSAIIIFYVGTKKILSLIFRKKITVQKSKKRQ